MTEQFTPEFMAAFQAFMEQRAATAADVATAAETKVTHKDALLSLVFRSNLPDETTVIAHQTALSELCDKLEEYADAKTKISDLESKVNMLQSSVSSLTSRVSALESRTSDTVPTPGA